MLNIAFAFAFLTILLHGVDSTAIRKAVIKGRPIEGVFLSLIAGTPVLIVLTVLMGQFNLYLLTPLTVSYLALGGILQFIGGRGSYYVSSQLIGTTRSNSIASSNIAYSFLFAVVILHESITINLLSGVTLILMGIIAITLSNPLKRSEGYGFGEHFSRGIIAALTTGALRGIGPIFAKLALNQAVPPLLASLVAYVFSTAVLTVGLSAYGIRRRFIIMDRTSLGLFLLGGVLAAFAQAASFTALSLAPVSTIVPFITGSDRIFSLLLAYFLLRKVELINVKTVIGVIAATLGAVLIVL